MLASFPARMVNQKSTDLGIPNRFRLNSSRFKREPAAHSILSPHGMKVIVQRAPGRTETISISPFPAYRDKKKKSRDNPRLSISR